MGLTISPTNTDALSRATGDQRGQASGVVQTVRQLGGTLGIAVVCAVIAALGPHGVAEAARQQSANAIGFGFLTASGAVVVSLVLGTRLLARGKLVADPQEVTAPAPTSDSELASAI